MIVPSCGKCGQSVRQEAKFCQKCGAPVVENTQPVFDPGPPPVAAPIQPCGVPPNPDETHYCGNDDPVAEEDVSRPPAVEITVQKVSLLKETLIREGEKTENTDDTGMGKRPDESVTTPKPAREYKTKPQVRAPKTQEAGSTDKPVKPGKTKKAGRTTKAAKEIKPVEIAKEEPIGDPVPQVAPPAPPEAISPPLPEIRTCQSCGITLDNTTGFCRECGVPVGASMGIPVPRGAQSAVTGAMPPQAAMVWACTSCGAPVHIDDAFCGDCGGVAAMRPAAPAPPFTPATSATLVQPPERFQVCGLCGHQIPLTERFCGQCGTPLTPVVVPAPPPLPVPPVTQEVKFCGQCGVVINGPLKFCMRCGTPVVEAPPAPPGPVPGYQPHQQQAQPVYTPANPVPVYPPPPRSQPVYAPVIPIPACPPPPPPPVQPAYTPPVPQAGEPVLGVIWNATEKISFLKSMAYTVVITPRRMIFAQLTGTLLNAAIVEVQARARAEGKSAFEQVKDQLTAHCQYSQRYFRMTPEETLAQTPGNHAIENAQITAINLKVNDLLNRDLRDGEFRMIIESTQGKTVLIIPEEERFTALLKDVYGERLHMPFGYVNFHGVKMKFLP